MAGAPAVENWNTAMENEQLTPGASSPADIGDSPYTVMLQNIPYSMMRKQAFELLLNIVTAGDILELYVPSDFKRLPKCISNRGFAYVRCRSLLVATRITKLLTGFADWSKIMESGQKIQSRAKQGIQVTPAKDQTPLIDIHRNSGVNHAKVPQECKPAIIQDGQIVDFPEAEKDVVTTPRGLKTKKAKKAAAMPEVVVGCGCDDETEQDDEASTSTTLTFDRNEEVVSDSSDNSDNGETYIYTTVEDKFAELDDCREIEEVKNVINDLSNLPPLDQDKVRSKAMEVSLHLENVFGEDGIECAQYSLTIRNATYDGGWHPYEFVNSFKKIFYRYPFPRYPGKDGSVKSASW